MSCTGEFLYYVYNNEERSASNSYASVVKSATRWSQGFVGAEVSLVWVASGWVSWRRSGPLPGPKLLIVGITFSPWLAVSPSPW